MMRLTSLAIVKCVGLLCLTLLTLSASSAYAQSISGTETGMTYPERVARIYDTAIERSRAQSFMIQNGLDMPAGYWANVYRAQWTYYGVPRWKQRHLMRRYHVR